MNECNAWIEIVLTPLGPISLVALLFAIQLYMNLSDRFGAVTKMPPYHRWFLVGGGFVVLALVVSILRSAAYLSARPEVSLLTSEYAALFFFHIPLLIGVVISIFVAQRYWLWLLTGEPGRD